VRAGSPFRVAGALVVIGATAVAGCSIWVVLDDPYKKDAAFRGDDGPASDAAESDGSTDDGSAADAGGAGDVGVGTRTLDATFVPSGIGVYADNVYVVDDGAQVHVASGGSTRFTSFWAGDAGGTFLIQRNGIAASGAGVFWTVSSGVRYCGIDGGACGLLPAPNARAIAASDSVVTWIDDTGVRSCAPPLDACSPTTASASKSAVRLAAGPNGVVAWTDGGTIVHIAAGDASAPVDLSPYEANVIATDTASGRLYWEGLLGVGALQFDGGGQSVSRLTSATKPTALFVDHGVVYWGLAAVVQHCRYDDDAGCAPSDLPSTGLRGPLTIHAMVADSRKVLAVVSSDMSLFLPIIAVWPTPP
jgi:hypothetical protein